MNCACCAVASRCVLGPAVDDNAATEVGQLAAELVERAGSERLGPYLPQLLQADHGESTLAAQVDLGQEVDYLACADESESCEYEDETEQVARELRQLRRL
jgi:hypothetical protein